MWRCRGPALGIGSSAWGVLACMRIGGQHPRAPGGKGGWGGAGTRRSADSRCSALVCRHRRTISACTAAHRQQVAKHGPARRGPPIGDLPGARTLATVAPAVGPLVPGYSVGRCCEWREGTHPGGSVPPQSGKRVVPPQRQDVAHR